MDSLKTLFMRSPIPAADLAPSLWWIIALPLIGAIVCAVAGRRLGRANTNLIASASVFGSFLISLLVFWAINDPRTNAINQVSGSAIRYAIGHDFGTWFAAGDFRVNFGLLVDHLSGIMLLVITGVGFLIHLYSTEYMSHDAASWRYFAYLNLFVAAMLTLVMADSLLLLFVGWEGVGMASYLLIGFWYNDPAKAWAGRKAFIANRVGDFGFLVASFLVVLTISAFEQEVKPANLSRSAISVGELQQGIDRVGPLAFQTLETFAQAMSVAPDAPETALGPKSEIARGPLAGFTYGGVITAILLFFLLGASGKSAQLPLYVWLPDAMAGPTPASALIHAATMVTAGVYLFCRLNFLLVFSPVAMATITLIGAFTALVAALIAFAQDDMKKVLAYSTVSQLGFMFMAAGAGLWWAAVFHLVTHAFFKACLFLGAGSVMHGNAEETNIKRLGGLFKEMPSTSWTFLIATLAITGIVPLSGFFSKDAILHGLHQTHLAEGLTWAPHLAQRVGQLAAFCTAFYMSRLFILAFMGKRSPDAKIAHAHESGRAMTLPLWVLAILSVAALVYGLPLMTSPSGQGEPVFLNFLRPVFATGMSIAGRLDTVVQEDTGGLMMAYFFAWLIALAGGALAAFLYLRFFPAQVGKAAPAPLAAVRSFAINKFYVDELYEAVVIKPLKFVSFFLYKVVDALFIDTVLVRGTAWVTQRFGSALRYVQNGNVQAYAALMALAMVGALAYALMKVL